MAVFTSVNRQDLQNWLNQHFYTTPHDQAGNLSPSLLTEVVQLEPIAAGVENTNYFLDIKLFDLKGSQQITLEHKVFTIFERMQHDQIDFCLRFMHFLAQKGLSVPNPKKTQTQQFSAPWLCNSDPLIRKPAAVVNRLAGASCDHPSLDQCQKLGVFLAQLHLAGREFKPQRPNLRDFNWVAKTASSVRPYLSTASSDLLQNALKDQADFQQSALYARLDRGAVHCDLFRDNVLFDEQNIPSVIDFYFSATESLVFDLCIVINDWAWDASQKQIDKKRADALLNAYQTVRSLTLDEKQAMPHGLRAAALRFWLSRLMDWFEPRNSSHGTPKDPKHFEAILNVHVSNRWQL